jgi:hypothetical protein
MKTNKASESFKFGCKFKASPYTPTKASCVELFMPFLSQIVMQCFKPSLHFFPALPFYHIHHISMPILVMID